MTVKAIFLIHDAGEESNGQIRAACRGLVLNGVGAGARFNQDFDFDPNLGNVNVQIHDAVKFYLINTLSVSFSGTDTLLLLPSVL